MRDLFKLGGKLFLLAACAGLLLGLTNAITAGPIEEQQRIEATAARKQVLPEAADFALIAESDGAIADIYRGVDAAGAAVGYTAKTTVQGFGGPIEVTVGVNAEGTLTGVTVGGSGFKETAGLGARTKDTAFVNQFSGQSMPVALRKNGGAIDAVTSATISSTAVVNGVNAAAEYLLSLAREGK